MISRYILTALNTALFERTEDGIVFGSIPDCPGVWATGDDEQTCRRELQEVFEDWLLLKLRDGDLMPVISGIDLNLQAA